MWTPSRYQLLQEAKIPDENLILTTYWIGQAGFLSASRLAATFPVGLRNLWRDGSTGAETETTRWLTPDSIILTVSWCELKRGESHAAHHSVSDRLTCCQRRHVRHLTTTGFRISPLLIPHGHCLLERGPDASRWSVWRCCHVVDSGSWVIPLFYVTVSTVWRVWESQCILCGLAGTEGRFAAAKRPVLMALRRCMLVVIASRILCCGNCHDQVRSRAVRVCIVEIPSFWGPELWRSGRPCRPLITRASLHAWGRHRSVWLWAAWCFITSALRHVHSQQSL